MKKNNGFPRPDPGGTADIQRTFNEMSLVDDVFFRAVMRDNPRAAEAIVRVALDMPDVEIESVETQKDIVFNGRKKGVRLDLKAKRPDGTLFDIEVQKGIEGDLARRGRYYLSSMTVDALGRGEGYRELPDAYVLFICDQDPFGRGRPVYSFSMRQEDGRALRDGGHVAFFNCSYKGKDAYGRLASDLTHPDFARIADPVLMDTVKSGKIGARRNDVMTELTEKLYNLAEARGREAGEKAAREAAVIAMLKDGRNSPEAISEILGIPLEDVLALKEREGI